MKKSLLIAVASLALISGCSTPGVRYAQNLFEHIPQDPQFIALFNPNDISNLLEIALQEIDVEQLLGETLGFETGSLKQYQAVAIEMLDILGIPVESVESVGVVVYYNKPIFILSGAFSKDEVTAKVVETGFQMRDDGFIDYVYDKQKLSIPADGLMMMAELELLQDLTNIPKEKSLWHREDFAEYRRTSPLDNSIFIWAKPPKDFMSDFPYRDDLGDVSLAMKFGATVTMNAVIRIKDPQKTVALHDILSGLVTVSKGIFRNDPDFAPVFSGIRITQNNRAVTASLVIPAQKVINLKERLKKDFLSEDTTTFEKLEKFLNIF